MSAGPDQSQGARLPSMYVAKAAMCAASSIDGRGSRVSDARESYWHEATGGVFPPADLAVGERLLVECGLVIDRGGILYPTSALHSLLEGTFEDALWSLCMRTISAEQLRDQELSTLDDQLTELVPDPARREELLLAFGRRVDDTRQSLVGAIGEEIVMDVARSELVEMQREDLARRVRHVSLESDQLGYDISAPRTSGTSRLLEVKATTSDDENHFRFFLSRNEWEVGTRFAQDWALVACRVANVEDRHGLVLGWCPVSVLSPLMPTDSEAGTWQQARVNLPTNQLAPGLPRPVP